MERLGTRVGRSEESAGVVLKSGTAAAGANMELGACSAVSGAIFSLFQQRVLTSYDSISS